MYTGNKKTEEKVASKLPEPQGYKILIGVPEVSDKTEGGVFMPDGLKAAEETASIIGFCHEARPRCLRRQKTNSHMGRIVKREILLSFALILALDLKSMGKSLDLLTTILWKQ